MPFYACSNGHHMHAQTPPERCLTYIHGAPCDGAIAPVTADGRQRHTTEKRGS